MFRFSIVSVLLVALVSVSFGQRRSQSESPCDLTVRVHNTQDRSLDTPVQVELLSPQGTPMMAAHVTGESPAQFQVMPGNSLKLRVSGPGIETTTSDSIYIYAWERSHSETVNVNMVDSSGANKATDRTGDSPTVSAAEMNIPPKARDELQKGTDAFLKGDLKKAQEHYEKAAAIYPQYARAYTDLGVIAIKGGDRGKAREMFSKSISVDEGFLPGYVDLARMDFQDRNYQQSEKLLQKVMSVNPSIPDALALLASAEFMNKEYDKALADAQRTHRLPNHEQFADIHLVAGQVYQMKNREQDAIAEYQLFLKESPNSPRVPSVQKQVAQLQAGLH
jgi:tetratricopeptide (TPR) repeat protein